MPKLSIIVPLYNEEEFAPQAIESALRQTLREIEIVIVDDGSTDRTPEIVAGYTDPRIVSIRKPNEGLSAARNTALTRASGEFVALLDGDDLLLPGYAKAMTEALDRRPDASFAFTDGWRLVDRRGRFRRDSSMTVNEAPEEIPSDPGALLEELMERNFIPVLSTIRRSALDTVGGFDTDLRSCEDYDMWFRMLIHGHSHVFVGGHHFIYRERAGQMTGSHGTMFRYLAMTYDKVARDSATPSGLALRARELAESSRQSERYYESRPLGWKLRRGVVLCRERLFPDREFLSVPPEAVEQAFPGRF